MAIKRDIAVDLDNSEIFITSCRTRIQIQSDIAVDLDKGCRVAEKLQQFRVVVVPWNELKCCGHLLPH